MTGRAQQVLGWIVGVVLTGCICALAIGVTVHAVRWLV